MKKESQPKNTLIKGKSKKTTIVKPPMVPSIEKEVPLFDPNTGEPNPLYEELTGKQNPLLTKWNKEDFFNAPQNLQPKLKNRFLVVFPTELKIKPYLVTEVKLPSTEKHKSIFGMDYYISSSLELTMIDSVEEPRLPVLFSWFKDSTKFDLSIEQLDPRNIIIQKFNFKSCLITKVDCDSMSYRDNDSDLYNYKLTISSNGFDID